MTLTFREGGWLCDSWGGNVSSSDILDSLQHRRWNILLICKRGIRKSLKKVMEEGTNQEEERVQK